MHEMSLQRSSGHAPATPLRHISEEHKGFTMSGSKAVGSGDLVQSTFSTPELLKLVRQAAKDVGDEARKAQSKPWVILKSSGSCEKAAGEYYHNTFLKVWHTTFPLYQS